MLQLFPKKSRSDSSLKKPKHPFKNVFQRLKGGKHFHGILAFFRTGADDITITNDDKTDFVAGDDKAEPTDVRLTESDKFEEEILNDNSKPSEFLDDEIMTGTPGILLTHTDSTTGVTVARRGSIPASAGSVGTSRNPSSLEDHADGHSGRNGVINHTGADDITITNDDKIDFVAGDDKAEPTDERLTESDKFSLTAFEEEILNDNSEFLDNEIMTETPGIFLTHTKSTTVTVVRRGSSPASAGSIDTSRIQSSLKNHAYGHSGRNGVINHYSNLEGHPNDFYGAKITGRTIVCNSFNRNKDCCNVNVNSYSSGSNGQTYFHWQGQRPW